MLIDTHTHISDEAFDEDRAEAMTRARSVNLCKMVNVSTDSGNWARYLEHAREYPEIFVALGIHPNHAADYSEANFAKMSALTVGPDAKKVVAIGETGLDFFRDSTSPEQQYTAFRAQLKLAHELKKPFILHCRKAEREMLDELKSFRDKTGVPLLGVWHCFSATVAFMEEAIALELYLGFGGILTYPKAQEVRDAAKAAPLDKLLLETDAPYLPPQPWRGKRNEPGYVFETNRKLAEIRGVSADTMAAQTTANAERLFKF